MTEHSLSENIQGLVDGSLADLERHLTLQWIEQSAPCYWRDLALAFVESQLLREAATVGLGRMAESKLSTLPPLPPLPPVRRRSLGSVWKWATAACLCIGTFIAGLALNSSDGPVTALAHPEQSTPLNSLIARTSPKSDLSSAPSSKTLPSPDVTRSAAAVRNLNAAIADSGYEASLMTRYVSQKLDDGGRIVIPVNKVIVRQRAE